MGDWLWAGLFALAAVAVLLYRRGLTAVQTMALQVMSIAIVSDWQNSSGGGLRDFNLYLNAGAEFLAGHSPYTTVALHHYPSGGLEHLPFLYAPPILPIFGFLSRCPTRWPAGSGRGSVALVVLSLRAFGLSWRWTFWRSSGPRWNTGFSLGTWRFRRSPYSRLPCDSVQR